MKVTFEATPGGDGECFLWKDVSTEDVKLAMGQERFNQEVEWALYFLVSSKIEYEYEMDAAIAHEPYITGDELERRTKEYLASKVTDEDRQKAIDSVHSLYTNDILSGLLGDYHNKRLRVTIQVEEIGEHDANGMPICKKCREAFDFDLNEPFAHCKCGTTEWGHDGDRYREIQKKLHVEGGVIDPKAS